MSSRAVLVRAFLLSLVAGALPACAALTAAQGGQAGEGGPTLADQALAYVRAVCELPEAADRAQVLDALNAAAAPSSVSVSCQ